MLIQQYVLSNLVRWVGNAEPTVRQFIPGTMLIHPYDGQDVVRWVERADSPVLWTIPGMAGGEC